jgi:hypothetical protein
MAISFKTLTQTDKTTSRTLLHESIPITGSLISGTYNVDSSGREVNIKTFSHGMFQSVYDYPYISSSANHIFDITAGFSTASGAAIGNSSLSASTVATAATSQLSKKVNIYTQMAQVLSGFNTSSIVRRFDQDGDLSEASSVKHDNAIFLNFSRLLVKDEIKKGSFSLELGTGSWMTPFATASGGEQVMITDSGSVSSYKINSPAGEYGLLVSGATNVGLIYYQAGVAILSSSVFPSTVEMRPGVGNVEDVLTGSTIDIMADSFRRRVKNIQFSNTTELNSTIYFCRANNTEFNYSSNPTYLSGSKIRVKTNPGTNEHFNLPRSYVTTVGLYSHDNELLAVAKLSEPLRKDPTNELTLRVRLDY